MQKYFKYTLLTLLSVFVLAGCSYQINPKTINSAVLPKDNIAITNFMSSKTYSTYDRKLAKITMYHFKEVNGQLRMSNVISYIPFDFYHELYRELTDVPMTLESLTHGKFKTLESALENEAARNHYTRLFKDKDEYIIGNDFAFEIQTAIKRYEDRMQRLERDGDQDNFKRRR
ncbi:MAG: hypothetical protein R3331_04820 [Sulfurospirillaceae bacterium]|nr:hypothetical protein [Sulfurospirillaceae bacterium]